MHDFLIEELGRAVPYGIYDIAANAGWVVTDATAPPGGSVRRPGKMMAWVLGRG